MAIAEAVCAFLGHASRIEVCWVDAGDEFLVENDDSAEVLRMKRNIVFLNCLRGWGVGVGDR